jgi:hypothetical protein
MRLEHRNHRVLVIASEHGVHFHEHLLVNDCKRRLQAAAVLFAAHDLDDIGVPTVSGKRERVCCITIRVNSLAWLSAVLHQKSHNFGLPFQDCMVESPMFVVLRDI